MISKNQVEMKKAPKGRVMIVDDHPIVRQGLAELINRESDLEVCGLAEDAFDAMKAIGRHTPDLVIADISLRGISGIDLIKDIKSHYPTVKVLALSMHDESLYAERAMRAGAKGYIMKQEATENVVTAIRKVLSRELYVSDRMAKKMMAKLVSGGNDLTQTPIDNLSDRELEVFLLIGQGYATRQISEQLHLSVKTIEAYRSHIKQKLSLGDSSELLQYAIRWVNA